MDWQWVAVAASVAGAAAYLGRQTWRTWSGRKSGCAGCSCASKTEAPSTRAAVPLIPPSELLTRLRER
jgi:hypothetical protein